MATKKPAKKAINKVTKKVWRVSVGGTALVRAYFEVEAGSEEEAWEVAQDKLGFVRFRDDDITFFEVRLDNEIEHVYEA